MLTKKHTHTHTHTHTHFQYHILPFAFNVDELTKPGNGIKGNNGRERKVPPGRGRVSQLFYDLFSQLIYNWQGEDLSSFLSPSLMQLVCMRHGLIFAKLPSFGSHEGS